MRPPPIAEGWGAFWIDDLQCQWCGKEWPATGDASGYGEGPDQRQYVSINITPKDQVNTHDPDGIHLCPECAEELAGTILDLLDAEVPMGMRPEDTETMCALPDDFYLWRSPGYIDTLWWDADDHCARDDDGNRVRYPNGTSYKLAMKQRKPYRQSIRKARR